MSRFDNGGLLAVLGVLGFAVMTAAVAAPAQSPQSSGALLFEGSRLIVGDGSTVESSAFVVEKDDPGFSLGSRRQFCSRFVREVLQESTGVVIGEAATFRELLERNPTADLRLWKVWYFGRIPWDRATVTPESLYVSPSLEPVFDGTLHRRPLHPIDAA